MAGENYFDQYDPETVEPEGNLGAFRQRESGNRNVYSNVKVPGYTQDQTGSGYYQIIPSTWREGAKLAGPDPVTGIDPSQYSQAIQAPRDTQTRVANALHAKLGDQPWALDAQGQANKPVNYFDRYDNQKSPNHFDQYDNQAAPQAKAPTPNYFDQYDAKTPADDLQGLDAQPNEPLRHGYWKDMPKAQQDVTAKPPAQELAPPTQPPGDAELAQNPQELQRVSEAFGNVGKAISEGWKNTPALLTPAAQAFADKWGLGSDARVVSTIVKAMGAGFQGSVQAAYELAKSVGGETLARDLAGYVESGGMTGAPHAPIMESLGLASEARGGLGDVAQPNAAAAAERPAPTNAGAGTPPATGAMVVKPTEALTQMAQGSPAPDAMPMLARMAGIAQERLAAPEAPVAPQAAEVPPVPAAPEAPPEAAVTPATAEEPATVNVAAQKPQESLPLEAAPEEAAPSKGTPYEKVPREPTRLNQYLRQPTTLDAGTPNETTIPGGIKDVGGDLKAIIGGSKGRPGLINNKSGASWDDAATRAWEAGYFPDHDAPPSISELQDAIRDDHSGTKRYSIQDQDRVEAYHQALDQNDEIDRLSNQYEIPATGNRDQFFDALHDRMSVEDRAREIESQDAASREAENVFRQGARTEAPDEVNDREFYGQSQFRTLEDLENERKQEAATPAAVEHAASPGEAGPVGPATTGSEEMPGPYERGTGTNGRPPEEGGAQDLLGRPLEDVRQAVATAKGEPTIRNDVRQEVMPGMEGSAAKAQMARDAGRGTLQGEGAQKPANEGLFAPDTSGQSAMLYSFPAAIFDPQAWRRAFGPIAPVLKSLRDATGKLGSDIRSGVAPMRRSPPHAQAMLADFANQSRQTQFVFGKIDQEFEKRFSVDQRARMWTKLDAQGVFEQKLSAMDPANRAQERAIFDASKEGLTGLTPEELKGVNAVDAISRDGWRRAQAEGIVDPRAEPLPYYATRQVMTLDPVSGKFTRPQGGGGGGRGIRPLGSNLTTAGVMGREHLEAAETEAAAQAKLGPNAALVRDIRMVVSRMAYLDRAIAGRQLLRKIEEAGDAAGGDPFVIHGNIPAGLDSTYFTNMDHPSFREWKGGGWQPLNVNSDFKGAFNAVLTAPPGDIYKAFMKVKGVVMKSIMPSPFIHLNVEMGRAFPTMPLRVITGRVLLDGSRLKQDFAYMDQAIKDGVSPLGSGWAADPVSIADATLGPSKWAFVRAWQATRDAAASGAGKAGELVGPKTGEFMHDVVQHPDKTLLWDQVFNLQMGIYDGIKKQEIQKGFAPDVAGTMAAHIANRYAGALPPEHLSRAANMMANILLFSRSFTLGNLAIMKDMFTGAPPHIMARIEQMAGPEVAKTARWELQKKAMKAVTFDVAMYYTANALLQSGMQAIRGEPAGQDWLEKSKSALSATGDNPLAVFGVLPQHWNEPGKQNRAYMGADTKGTGVYARLPFGKVGEEFLEWPTMTGPLLMNKLNPMIRPALEAAFGHDTLGREVYKPDPKTIGDNLRIARDVVTHMAKGLAPVQMIQGASELFQQEVMGKKTKADTGVSAAKALLPWTGLAQISQGYPGGPAAGEIAAEQRREKYDQQQELPAIREKIQNGDLPGAESDMRRLGIQPWLGRYYIQQEMHPGPSKGGMKRLGMMPPETQERVQRDMGMQPQIRLSP